MLVKFVQLLMHAQFILSQMCHVSTVALLVLHVDFKAAVLHACT